MKYTNKVIKLANIFDFKIKKYAEDMGHGSTEAGVHKDILFPNKSNGVTLWNDACVKAVYDVINSNEKYYSCKSGKAWFNITTDGKGTGTIDVNVDFIFPAIDKSSDEEENKAAEAALAAIKKSFDEAAKKACKQAYKTVMNMTVEQRAQALNKDKKFPTNAQKASPEVECTFTFGK